MATRHLVITITGSSQNLAAGISGVDACKFLSLQADGANAGIIYIGDNVNTVSSSLWGLRMEVPAASIPQAPIIFEGPIISLGDIKVIGTANDKLHVFLVT